MLSSGRQAKPFAGLRPSCVAICSKLVHLIPSWVRRRAVPRRHGHSRGQASSAFVRLANARCQNWHELNVLKPEAAARCGGRPAGSDAGRAGEVQREQPAVRHGSERDRVLERGARDDPVEDARVVVRRSGAAGSRRPSRRSRSCTSASRTSRRSAPSPSARPRRRSPRCSCCRKRSGRRRDGVAAREEEVGEHAAVPWPWW